MNTPLQELIDLAKSMGIDTDAATTGRHNPQRGAEGRAEYIKRVHQVGDRVESCHLLLDHPEQAKLISLQSLGERARGLALDVLELPFWAVQQLTPHTFDRLLLLHSRIGEANSEFRALHLLTSLHNARVLAVKYMDDQVRAGKISLQGVADRNESTDAAARVTAVGALPKVVEILRNAPQV